jgi:hypothetical protein
MVPKLFCPKVWLAQKRMEQRNKLERRHFAVNSKDVILVFIGASFREAGRLDLAKFFLFVSQLLVEPRSRQVAPRYKYLVLANPLTHAPLTYSGHIRVREAVCHIPRLQFHRNEIDSQRSMRMVAFSAEDEQGN